MTQNNDNLPTLPKRWAWTTIDAILRSLESGGRPKGGVKGITEGVPSVGGEHLEYRGTFNFTNLRYIPRDFFEKMPRGRIRPRDILVVKDGATTGKTAYVPDSFPFDEATVNEHVFILRVFPEFTESKYLCFWMQSNSGQLCVKNNFQGTAQGGINSQFTKNSRFPFAPLTEQKRIVAKIEELFTRLDAGVVSLKKIKAELKRYQQAVLKTAFEGKLTAEWRQKNKDKLEPANKLLERIAKEREKQAGNKRQRRLLPLDTRGLYELPKGWIWTRVGDISRNIQYGTSEKAHSKQDGIPVIRMGNLGKGKLVFENLKYFPKDWPDLQIFLLQDGDVLFNRTNSAELVGKTAVYKKNHPPAVFASYLIRVNINNGVYLPDLLASFINSFYGRKYIASVVSQQVGQANVNGTKLSNMPVPLLSLSEQQKIVSEIERHFSIADEIEHTIEQCLKEAERLRKSILKRAFEGKLVPQDPADEPAEKLLEKIKAEKEKFKKDIRGKKPANARKS